ncbi:kelch repeat protein-like protein [Westerdykella ornata]|uniref:Kelch repeat protein-like protein n=1 Tax=Westerdykella ornata TaxID=318751 RepID=A0A6A6JEA2_WESOR|nr:kelch repeat protein-like protein [Westerdykella ornata]KAF2273986.1 kelch repeat protein-like protein [Westerdykella ornata]
MEVPKRRKSVFMEVGLVDEATVQRERSPAPTLISRRTPKSIRPSRTVRFRSQNSLFGDEEGEDANNSDLDEALGPALADMATSANSNMRPLSYLSPQAHRLALLVLGLILVLPILHTNPLFSIGARASAIPSHAREATVSKREDTNTQVCKRWAHQSAVVNGTLYIYGGRSTTDSKQTSNTWTNDFLALDLTKSWQISSPSLRGLPRPSGPPKVSMGYLWGSLNSLFFYGGEFSDDPQASPTAFSTWEYQIGSNQWVEHKEPKTSAGEHAPDDGQPVHRSAEGAGFGVATLGRGWYFGGHLDFLTTEGWSNQVPRVYLKSLLEFTFPGYTNKQVKTLEDGKTAGPEGVYRNITEGGLQDTAGFPERADGLLVYIPGFGEEGILLGLTGGVNESFTQMNVIDVFDIATSKWYKQSTSGRQPQYRVNPCAVVAAAADGSSYNIYMFGGQNLQPFKNQTQYDDMWILSVPSFTWIEVKMGPDQSVPYPRAGHTCHIWDSQMIVVGGYVGQELSCDAPGIYVFNTSSLQWSDQFTALTGERALRPFDGNKDSGNPLAQQANQRGFDAKAGLQGSYGYAVPPLVQSVIGGKETGGATLTAPVQTPTEGPLVTGRPHTYTVTGPNGAVITEVSGGGGSGGGGRGTNTGAIVAGTIAGVFAVVAGYMAFCAWVYRKQVKMWKAHAAATAARTEKHPDGALGATGPTATSASGKDSSDRNASDALFPPTDSSSAGGARMSNDAGPASVVDPLGRRSSGSSSTEDLLAGQEPTFWGARGVLLNPRRSLRVINRD